jgi:hypothetical protein
MEKAADMLGALYQGKLGRLSNSLATKKQRQGKGRHAPAFS